MKVQTDYGDSSGQHDTHGFNSENVVLTGNEIQINDPNQVLVASEDRSVNFDFS